MYVCVHWHRAVFCASLLVMDNETTIGGFKKFVKGTSRIIDKISITSGGSIGFSSSFSSEHNLDRYSYTILYWNASRKEVGIQFTTAESDEAIKLISNKYGQGRTLNARAFFTIHHIDTSKYKKRYTYRIVPFNQLDPSNQSTENMYIISLTDSENVAVTPPQLETPVPPSLPQSPINNPEMPPMQPLG